MDKLKGRVALVTGASRGIGRGIAVAYGAEGAAVGVNYCASECDALEAVREIETLGGRAMAIKADVTEPAEVQAMVDRMIETYGRIDILVNNAGTLPHTLAKGQVGILDMTYEYWSEYLDLNLGAVFLVTRAVLPHMVKGRFGRIINVSSQMAWKGNADIVAYCAAKGGVNAFTRAVARAVADYGITVNVIAPGPIVTGAHEREGMTKEDMAKQAAGLPLKRYGLVGEVTPTAVLLAASPDGDYYTGVSFHPNGGDVMV